MPDPAPDWVAQFDQMRAGLKDMATLMREYFTSLIDAGFSPDEAMQITVQWQASVIVMATGGES